jgi:hypothetical protein
MEEFPVQRQDESEKDFSRRKSHWEAARLEERKAQQDLAAEDPISRFKRLWSHD